jgi:dihydrofolate synthase/folylpolyglutamate synthase
MVAGDTVRPREVLLDGAHNPDGAAALAQALDDLRPFLVGGREASPPPVTLLVAVMADKDVDGIVKALAASRVVRDARVVATRVEAARALPAEELADRWRALVPGAEVEAVADPDAALERVLGAGDGPVVVAGSLYLVGHVRGRLVDDPLLRDPVDEPPVPAPLATPR